MRPFSIQLSQLYFFMEISIVKGISDIIVL